MTKPKGWKQEPMRHALAAKGIHTGKKSPAHMKRLDFPKPSERTYNTKAVIYVPSTKNKTDKVSDEEYQKRVAETEQFLIREFGGTTKTSSVGSYTTNEGKVVHEDVTKVECFSPSPEYKKKDRVVKSYLQKKTKEWGQESVAFEFEDDKGKSSMTLVFA